MVGWGVQLCTLAPLDPDPRATCLICSPVTKRQVLNQEMSQQSMVLPSPMYVAASTPTQAKMVALERRAAELAREAAAAREAGADAVRVAERRVAEAERRAAGLAEENAGLLTELQARPTLQEKQ